MGVHLLVTWPKQYAGSSAREMFTVLQGDGDRQRNTRVHTVIKIIPVVIVNVNVVGVIPIFRPVFGPRVNQQERKAAVLETRIPNVHRGAAADAEEVLAAEIETEGLLRNIVTAIASALRPRAMLVLPLPGSILLPGFVPLPTALPCPSPLLLP